MLKIGWIDFSSEHREKVMGILDLMKEKGATDELGIGVVRDRIADKLFPGTSTIQTRAKYLLLVPWIMKDLEDSGVIKAKDYTNKLSEKEIEFIHILLKNEETDGVIGKQSKDKLKRKPSSIYWNALKTYNICTIDRSISDYIKYVEYIKNKNESSKFIEIDKKLSNYYDKDDKDANSLGKVYLNWNICNPPENWKESLDINLNYTEARFLRERIIISTKGTLLSLILENYLDKVTNYTDIKSLQCIDIKDKNIKSILDLAINFADIIFGIHIKYNMMIKDELNEKYENIEDKWNTWCLEMSNFDWNSFDEELLWNIVHIDQETKEFLSLWFEFAKLNNFNDDKYIKDEIRKREKRLKGSRSKLGNVNKIIHGQEWIGLGKLDYRWRNTRKILVDIEKGIKSYV
ncbi:MAG: DUF6361 family protein [Romboutsia sp.]